MDPPLAQVTQVFCPTGRQQVLSCLWVVSLFQEIHWCHVPNRSNPLPLLRLELAHGRQKHLCHVCQVDATSDDASRFYELDACPECIQDAAESCPPQRCPCTATLDRRNPNPNRSQTQERRHVQRFFSGERIDMGREIMQPVREVVLPRVIALKT